MKKHHTQKLFFRIVTPFAIALLLTSCAGMQNSPPKANCTAVESDFNYYDSATFDSRLSRTMICRADEVTLSLPSPESTGKIPERLDRWLAAVDESGGKVTVEKDPNKTSEYIAKGFDGGIVVGAIFDLVDIAKMAYQEMKDKKLYGPAEGYDATVYYEDGTGAITGVVFSKR